MWVSPRDAMGFFSLSIFRRLLGSWVLSFVFAGAFVFGFVLTMPVMTPGMTLSPPLPPRNAILSCMHPPQ